MKDKYIKAYMKMAKCFSETSNAKRKKVGALIVKNDTIISQGVNGQPPGWHTEVCEDSDNNTLKTVRHAEVACLEKLQRSTESSVGGSMFVTLSPCLDCAIKLASAGISKVYYEEKYRCTEGLDYLASKEIPCIHVDLI